MFTRREVLLSTAALAALPAGVAHALGSADRRFLFVIVPGGWDPLTVFAPLYGSAGVELEAESALGSASGISFVDHPARPSVRAFFEQHGARTILLNGISVPSVAHESCTLLALTGSSSSGDADWATRLGAAQSEAYALPHLVLSGPSMPGDRVTAVARAGAAGQLDALLSGGILEDLDTPVSPLGAAAERILDRYLARRLPARRDASRNAGEEALIASQTIAHDRARRLKALRYELDFAPGARFGGQLDAAVRVLSKGVARCVTVAHPGAWDTHGDNRQQSPLFEDLFAGLGRAVRLLDGRRGPTGAPLSSDTVLVVLSEMGRTPRFNANGGRDHWPYTSALCIGPGITGGRVVGAYDDRYYGRGVDPKSGETSDKAPSLGVETLGATLLALGGVDPASELPSAHPLTGVLT